MTAETALTTRVLHVSPEMAPLAKRGGMGDVVGALPRAMQKTGIDARVLLPLWPGVLDMLGKMKIPLCREYEDITVSLDWRIYTARVVSAIVNDIRVYLLDQPELFQNPYIYPEETTGESAFPFIFLSYAAMELGKAVDWTPHIIHAHDWPGAFVPCALQWHRHYRTMQGSFDTVLTIHNMAHQCVVGRDSLDLWGLSWDAFAIAGMEFYGQVNVLKGGINSSGAVTTVSPHYSWEIQTIQGGFGLDGVLVQNRHKLQGILNGVDYEVWNPSKDPALPSPYSSRDFKGKRDARQALLKRCGFQDRGHPVCVFVSRLVEQKGVDLLLGSMGELLQKDIQLLVLGNGHESIERAFIDESKRFPQKLWVHTDFDEDLAHLFYGGGDFLLMPSLFEPCGLSQIIAMRYGTVPIVRAVGGLSDTVIDVGGSLEDGNGFIFLDYSKEEFLKAIDRGLMLYKDPPEWEALGKRNMKVNFSWERSAKLYEHLYTSLLEGTFAT